MPPRPAAFLLFLVVLALSAGVAGAHPPSAMELTYDQAAGVLSVNATHVVADPQVHHVSLVAISRDGGTLDLYQYTGQATNTTFAAHYPVKLNPGETVKVTASCNQGGSITREFIMPGPTAAPAHAVPGLPIPVLWPVHAALMVAGFLCFLGAALLPVYGKNIRGWYHYHTLLGGGGSVLTEAALAAGFAMVSLSGTPHLRLPHAWLGVLVAVVLAATLVLAWARNRTAARKPLLRAAHLWTGRVLFVLMAANILSGLVAAGVLGLI